MRKLSDFPTISDVRPQIRPVQLSSNLQAVPNETTPFVCKSPDRCKCRLASPPSEGLGLYQDLPSGDHFRILEILPGVSGIPECKLHVGQLPEDAYTYEALSYTWDLDTRWNSEHDSEAHIRCNGMEIPVAINLARALQRVRDKDVSRMIWADALCINQTDVSEKTYQVSKMGLIFENAAQVIIWLGDNETHCEQPIPVHLHYPYQGFSGVCAVVNAWKEQSGYDSIIPVATHSPGLVVPPTKSHSTLQSSIYEPWRSLFESWDRPLSNLESWGRIFEIYGCRWFSRLWVMQEVALARSAIVLWDDCEISWEWIGLAAAIIRSNYDAICAVMQDNPYIAVTNRIHMGLINAYLMFRLSKSQHYIAPLEFTFYELLKYTRQFGCQDDRDRVYGLLGLPTADDVSNNIIPDYNKSVGEVYCDVAKKIIASSSSLAILSSVQRDKNHGQFFRKKRFNKAMPSWIPQWNVLTTRSLTPQHCIGLASPSYSQLQQKDTGDPLSLEVRGLLIDSVDSCAYTERLGFSSGIPLKRYLEPELEHSSMEDLIQKIKTPLKDFISDLVIGRKYFEEMALTLTTGQDWLGCPVQDVSAHLADFLCCLLDGNLWWSLVKDAFTDTEAMEEYLHIPSMEELYVLKHLARIWGLEVTPKNANGQRFLDIAATFASGHSRFITSSGLIGIGPKAMKPNDTICILYGAAVPFIIRPRIDGSGYTLIGECYIHDLMLSDSMKDLDQIMNKIRQKGIQTEETWIALR